MSAYGPSQSIDTEELLDLGRPLRANRGEWVEPPATALPVAAEAAAAALAQLTRCHPAAAEDASPVQSQDDAVSVVTEAAGRVAHLLTEVAR